MLSEYAAQWKSRMQPQNMRLAPRRAAQPGDVAGQDPSREPRQPQDATPETDLDTDTRSRVTDIAAHLQRTFIEPEDARITGTTRSLMRRLIGLNVGVLTTARNAALPVRSLTSLTVKEPRVA